MSSTSSTLSSVLSALGGSNGIDVTSAVNSILYADRAPERGWQAQQATLATQKTAINTLNSDSSSLSDQLYSLQSASGVLNSLVATSSDSSVVTASAAAGTPTGTHTVVVNNLATTGSWYSAEVASSSTPLSGSFDLTAGGTTTTITLGAGNNTLSTLAASINAQSLGVTASVVQDSNGARLSLAAQSSGSAADLSISGSNGLNFTQAIVGINASVTVDGVPIVSATNTIQGALSGVTLNLQNASPNESVSLNLAPATSNISNAIAGFVSAYNQLVGDLKSDVTYSRGSSTAGTLQSDSTAQAFFSDLLASTNFSSGAGSFNTLAALGISTNTDGTLSLNSTTLANAIQTNPIAVSTFFQGASGNSASSFASSLTATLDQYTNTSNGAFTIDLQSISAENTDLANQTTSLEVYLANQQTLLTTEYNNADIAIQKLPQELKNINALLNPNSNSSSNG